MNLQARRGSGVIRQVLKEVINVQNSSSKRYEDLEKAKLSEVILFLQKKIDRQHSQIKVISQQLSKEISLKQQLLISLNEQKEKSNRLSQHLASANRSNHELKSKVAKSKIEASCEEKQDLQMKISKYRDIVRRKDQQILKNQQKLQELLHVDRNFNQLEADIRAVRESYAKLKHREESLMSEVQKLKQKLTQANQKIQEKEEIIIEKDMLIRQEQQKVLIYQQHLKRVSNQYSNLLVKHQQSSNSLKLLEQNSNKIIMQQLQEIQRLSERTLETISLEQAKWDLSIYKKEAKRSLQAMIKDANLRRKIQKQVIQLLSEVQKSFSKIMGSVFEVK